MDNSANWVITKGKGKSVLESGTASRIFEYMKEVAKQISVKSKDGTAILWNQYQIIDFLSNDNVGAMYLNPKMYKSKTELDDSVPIFPFGGNESQFKAVQNALSNRISVIEGPPGTGKTQTILNIIANIVLQGKSLQIVSNNNSAIDNVLEKLSSDKYNMGYIVARLGSTEKKEKFLKSQSGVYPDFSEWIDDKYESEEFYEIVKEQSRRLQEIYQDQNHLARLRQEYYDIQIEYEHLKAINIDCLLNITSKNLSSAKIMEFMQEYQDIQNGIKKAGILYRIYCYLFLGINVGKLIKEKNSIVVNSMQCYFYEKRLREIDSDIAIIKKKLDGADAGTLITTFTEMSLKCFKARLAKRYKNKRARYSFTKDELWKTPEIFTKEYPVVLSTTYTARSSLGKKAKFDYIIVDEASQVDVVTGLLSLSCASNAVIVGDTKQLPNVITKQDKEKLDIIFSRYNIDEAYNFTRYSFLESLCRIMKNNIPRVILYEHYRCHPQIIGFCNEKFYDGSLIVMSSNNDKKALKLVTTVSGNHARGHINQRQIDVICQDILPSLNFKTSEIGIIAPYRNQINQLKNNLGDTGIEIDTVHKFQGREKDVIILSTVDDVVTNFSDDSNLLNVAVSRAKKQLIVVAANQEQPVGSNVGDLIKYIRYNNCDIQHSNIASVFDYLYNQYADSRRKYLQKHKRISEFDSENLMYVLIKNELQKRADTNLDVVCHYPLNLLFTNLSEMDDEEKRFVNTGLSHIDFLIFIKVSKQPILAIEVDGFKYHKAGTRQAERDKLKNHIMEIYKLPLLRFATNGSGECKKLSATLDNILNVNIK